MTEYILSFDPGTKNIAYCLIQKDNLEIKSWKVFSIESGTYEGRAKKLMQELDTLKPTDIPNSKISVIVEQQMGINTKTNRICGMLFMYYTINNQNIHKIVQYPAKYKNNYYRWQLGDPQPYKGMVKNKIRWFVNERIGKLKISKTNAHYRSKKTLEEHCRRILRHNQVKESWVEYFESNKSKQDDLADSYVQSLSYIKYPSGNRNKNWLENWDPNTYKEPEPKPLKKKPKKRMSEDMILNPDTGRYVKKTGKIGKKLLKELSA